MATVKELEPGEAQTETMALSSMDAFGDALQPLYPQDATALIDFEPPYSVNGLHHHLDDLPNELLLQILIYLDIPDLLSTSRVNHHLRTLSIHPHLHSSRLRLTRHILPPLLTNPQRPSLSSLIAQSIFLTPTHLISKRLARSLASISLSRRLARRPSAQWLIDRAVLPRECVPPPCRRACPAELYYCCSPPSKKLKPVAAVQSAAVEHGEAWIAPGLIAKKRQVEREKVKDELRNWIGGTWMGRVREKGERVRREEWRRGTGRVWRLRRFWERVGKGEVVS